MNYIRKHFSGTDEKSIVVSKNIVSSVLIKGINISVNFLIIPLVLSFLDSTQYGIWLTLTAILSWFSIFDLGFGNGLRNRLTISLSVKNFSEARVYVSTTYVALCILFGILWILFLFINPYLNWLRVFNAPEKFRLDLGYAVIFSISLLFVQFILRLISTICLAYQKSALSNLFIALIQLATLLGLYFLKLLGFHSLFSVSMVYSISPILIYFVASVIFFSSTFRSVRPSLVYFEVGHIKSLMGLGLNFFIIQIAALVIFASDNFLIAQLFSPEEVTTYNIAFRYFSVAGLFFPIILAPFWSMTTKAFAENDLQWIRNAVKKLITIWMIFLGGIGLQLILANPFYKFWTGNLISVPISLSIALAIYFLVVTWGNIFSNFLNGVGKIKLQFYLAGVSMLLNIPLAFFFVRFLHFGIVGIPLSTICVTTLTSLIAYLQYRRIISNQATGLWNQ